MLPCLARLLLFKFIPKFNEIDFYQENSLHTLKVEALVISQFSATSLIIQVLTQYLTPEFLLIKNN